MAGMRILFIGCVLSSYRLLSELMENKKNVIGVITKNSSDFNADFTDLTPLCTKHSIPYHYVNNINDADSMEFIRSLSPDICYCFGWSQLLGEDLISAFPKGVVGFHPTALPKNRGRHPLIWALALGLSETASTFFMINTGADTGDIVSQRAVRIDYEDDAQSLYDKVLNVAARQVIELTKEFESDSVTVIPQKPNEGNTWRKRGRTDGQIDWRMSARCIYNLVRSLTRPYVGAHFVYKGQDYKVWRAEELESAGPENIEPGKVLAIGDDGTMDVKVGGGAIRLIDFERPRIHKGDYIL